MLLQIQISVCSKYFLFRNFIYWILCCTLHGTCLSSSWISIITHKLTKMHFFFSCRYAKLSTYWEYSVFSHVIFVLFILVYKTIIKIQPSNALTQLFVLVHLQSVLCLTTSLWFLLPFLPEKTFHLTGCWAGWSLSLFVSSLKYVLQLTKQSWSCSYSDQSLECVVVSSLHTCISFSRKPKLWRKWEEKSSVIVAEPTLGSWVMNFTCLLWSYVC